MKVSVQACARLLAVMLTWLSISQASAVCCLPVAAQQHTAEAATMSHCHPGETASDTQTEPAHQCSGSCAGFHHASPILPLSTGTLSPAVLPTASRSNGHPHTAYLGRLLRPPA